MDKMNEYNYDCCNYSTQDDNKEYLLYKSIDIVKNYFSDVSLSINEFFEYIDITYDKLYVITYDEILNDITQQSLDLAIEIMFLAEKQTPYNGFLTDLGVSYKRIYNKLTT